MPLGGTSAQSHGDTAAALLVELPWFEAAPQWEGSPQWDALHWKLVLISPALRTVEKEHAESVPCLPAAASERLRPVPIAHDSSVPVVVGRVTCASVQSENARPGVCWGIRSPVASTEPWSP